MDFNIDWERLKNISPTLRPFQPTKENLEFLSGWLMKGFLNLSDENRKWERIHVLMGYYFPYHLPPEIRPFHIMYEIGNFAGILGFVDISLGYKATIFFKYWDKDQWNHKVYRGLKDAHKVVMDELKLKRLSAESPDFRIVNLAKKLGYVVEGRQKWGFKWNGKTYTNHLMRMVQED